MVLKAKSSRILYGTLSICYPTWVMYKCKILAWLIDIYWSRIARDFSQLTTKSLFEMPKIEKQHIKVLAHVFIITETNWTNIDYKRLCDKQICCIL